MQTIPKARPVPVARRTTKQEMGRSVIPDHSHGLEDTTRQPNIHAMSNNPNMMMKAARTPDQERRSYPKPSPSPAPMYGHPPPKSSPAIRPQSAMGLTSPPSNNSYNNNYNFSNLQQPRRPPSSLGLAGGARVMDTARNQYDQVVMHRHSRSFGDGVNSEQVYTDALPPKYVPNHFNPPATSHGHQDDKTNLALGENMHKESHPTKMTHNGPRGSYNPSYASHLDLNSRAEAYRDRSVPGNAPRAGDGLDSGTRVMSKSSVQVTPSQDLRSAWQRLYGQGPDISNRRPSVDNMIQPNQSTRIDENAYQMSPRQQPRSPQYAVDSFQGPAPRSNYQGKQVAGPMVTPFTHDGRQTPPGQCATTQNQQQGLNNPREPALQHSPRPRESASHYSPRAAVKPIRPTTPRDSPSLGPASKYPDPDMGLRKATKHGGNPHQNDTSNFGKLKDSGRQTPQTFQSKDHNENRTIGLQNVPSRFTHNHAFCSDSENENEEDIRILPEDSIFDYAGADDSEEDSVAQLSKTLKGSQQMFDPPRQQNDRDMVHLKQAAKPTDSRHDLKTAHYARSRSLEDVRESGDESNVSFDIENTMLLVEPSDASEMGTLRSKNSDVKTKLNRLEGMYAKVMHTLESQGPKESRGRRWSIGSSDTNSLRHQVHRSKHGRSSATQSQRVGNRDVKSINKRFQRLESHVITLARSIAHISSELRTQTTMSREIENVKREIQELKVSGNGNGAKDRKRHDPDKYRGFNHPLTNPRQVNKLTRFFGQEPSWLEIFLTRLGYEQYVKNFHQEHIGMMELPYMTDEQLKSIGIPMGPRTRILQESQMCFKDDNFNIYIV